MSHPIRNMIMLSATALALIAAPVLVNQTGLSDLSAFAKDKGNGGGGGEGGGGSGGNGNGGGNGGEHGNGGGNGGGSGESQKSEGKGKKVADTETLTTTSKAAKGTKTKNLNAQLAGLNSLKRNINGLMNSSDPRMELVRDYVEASAELETAEAALTEAEGLLGDLQAAFDTYLDGYVATELAATYDAPVYDDPTLETLNGRLGELDAAIAADPLNQAAIDERADLLAALEVIEGSAELAAVTEQQGVIDGLEEEIAGLEELTSEEALQAALLTAANKNRVAEAGGEAYLTPEIMAWATARIEALTDQYQAQQ